MRTATAEKRLPEQCSLPGDLAGVADQWRSCSSGWLPEDGSRQCKWLMAPHQWKWPLMEIKMWPRQRKWLMVPRQQKWLLMQILPKIKTQRQMAGQMTTSVWHLLTQRHRRCQSGSGPNKMSRLRRRKLHRLVRRKLHVRGRGGCVRGRGRTACEDVAGITFTEGGRTR